MTLLPSYQYLKFNYLTKSEFYLIKKSRQCPISAHTVPSPQLSSLLLLLGTILFHSNFSLFQSHIIVGKTYISKYSLERNRKTELYFSFLEYHFFVFLYDDLLFKWNLFIDFFIHKTSNMIENHVIA